MSPDVPIVCVRCLMKVDSAVQQIDAGVDLDDVLEDSKFARINQDAYLHIISGTVQG